MIPKQVACAFLLAVAVAAGRSVPATTPACIDGFDPHRDYFQAKAAVTDAARFSIEYHGSYKIVTVQALRGGAKPLRYLLVMCGAPVPRLDGIDATVTIPIRRVVVLSNAYLPFLSALGVSKSVVAVNDYSHVSDAGIRARIEAGEVSEVGRETSLNRERLAALRPDVVLSYGDGGLPESLMPLVRTGLNAVVTAEYREASPLGYAEWIKFFAAFFNAEAAAADYFDGMAARYRALRTRAVAVTRKPMVLVGGSYRGVWYAPAPRSYTAQLIADAGAKYAFEALEQTDSAAEDMVPVDLETALAYGHGAEFWIDTLDWQSRAEALAQDGRYALFDAFIAGRMFNNDAQRNAEGANAFWEIGLANPDSVLADLIAIFHPQLSPGHVMTWYRRLPERSQ